MKTTPSVRLGQSKKLPDDPIPNVWHTSLNFSWAGSDDSFALFRVLPRCMPSHLMRAVSRLVDLALISAISTHRTLYFPNRFLG